MGESEREPVVHRGRLPGPDNPNWRGGRSVASNGYMLVRAGVGHHLADVRGYAYEHRLVVLTHAEHGVEHRTRKDRQLPEERNPWIYCGCGCRARLQLYDKYGRPRRFISGHNGSTRSA